MKGNVMDSYFFSLVRVVDDIYQEEDLSDILHFIVSLATELTGGKGCTIRVLEHGSFNLKILSSVGLSKEYLESGAIDQGRSITEIMEGDTIIINNFETDSRIQDRETAKKEGLRAVIGIPFTVNETTYSILRVYFSSEKVPTHEEIELLNTLGKLSCLAIERAVIGEIRKGESF